jgi:hypothetical protein
MRRILAFHWRALPIAVAILLGPTRPAWPSPEPAPPDATPKVPIVGTPVDRPTAPPDPEVRKAQETRAALEDIRREADVKRAEKAEQEKLRNQVKRRAATRRRPTAPALVPAMTPRQRQLLLRQARALQNRQRPPDDPPQPGAGRLPDPWIGAFARPGGLMLPPPPANRMRPFPGNGRPGFEAIPLGPDGQVQVFRFRGPNGGGMFMRWGVPAR